MHLLCECSQIPTHGARKDAATFNWHSDRVVFIISVDIIGIPSLPRTLQSSSMMLIHRILPWLLLFVSSTTFAQLPTADLSRISPRAAIAGESVEVTLFGKNLDGLTALKFTHAGIDAKPVLLPAAPWASEPRIDGNRFVVSVDASTPPGTYEARAIGFFGASTSRPFVVASGDLNEVSCEAKNNTRSSAMLVDMNSVVSGEVGAREVRWFRFSASAGQRVLIEVRAERIDSRLDSQLILYDSEGREIQRNRDSFGRDAFLDLQPDSDGEFFVSLSDILFRGGGEHFYRLSISTRPHLDFVWPPAGQPGATETFTIFGRNLRQLDSIAEKDVVDGSPMTGGLESVQLQIAMPTDPVAPDGFFAGHW